MLNRPTSGNRPWQTRLFLRRLPVFLVAVAALAAGPLEAADAQAGVIATDILITSDKTADGSDGWIRFSDDTKQWIDGACRARLTGAGAELTVVSWSTIAGMADSNVGNCDDLVAMVQASSANVILITDDKQAPGSDGWVLRADGTKQWVDGACRTELESAGMNVEIRPWSDISSVPDGAALSCDELAQGGAGGTGGGDDSGTTNGPTDIVTTGDKQSPGSDGWVRFGDGTRQWVSVSCRANLEASGMVVSVLSWDVISGMPDHQPTEPCEALVADGGGSHDPMAVDLGSGVNVMSGEYACVREDGGYGFFDHRNDGVSHGTLADMIVTKVGAHTVRLPLNEHCWLGYAEFDYINDQFKGENYRSEIEDIVGALNARGLTVVLDLHFSAPRGAQATSQQEMADADFAPYFWDSVARRFKDNPNVIFDLYNEPHYIDWACWRDGCARTTIRRWDPATGKDVTAYHEWTAVGMQDLVDAVRGAGARQPIILSGKEWGHQLGNDWLDYVPVDPENNLIAGMHLYGGQNDADCNSSCAESQLSPVVDAGFAVVISEVGDSHGEDPGPVCRTEYLEQILTWADGHDVPYLAYTFNPGGCGTPPLLDKEGGWTNPQLAAAGEVLKTHLAG